MTTQPYQGVFTINDVREATIAGKWSAYIAPVGPPITTFGWFIGGFIPGSSVQSPLERITYANDTIATSIRGNLSVARDVMSSATNGTNVWTAGGSPSDQAANCDSLIDRIVLATDTANATSRSDLNTARQGHSAVSDGTNAWFGGGTTPAINISTIERLVYATDTTNSTIRSNLTQTPLGPTSVSNGTNGWFAGGQGPGGLLSNIDRIIFATDTANATTRSNISLARFDLSSVSDGTNAWWVGGNASPSTSLIDRTTFSTDTTNAASRCMLSVARYNMGSVTDGTNSWFAGGNSPALPTSNTSLIDRFILANDTVNATSRTNLSNNKRSTSASNNTTNAGY